MKLKHGILSVIMLAACAAAPLACSAAPATEPAPAAEAAKTQYYKKLVDLDYVKQYAVIPARDDVMIIDSRPAARKYDVGHIPGAVNIPDTQFDALAPKMLPADKSKLLIFYCEGPECSLSHKGAFKAEKLGYTNIVVYTNGYPEWAKKGNLGAVSPAFVKKQLDEKAPITLIDSRPKARKYDKGHIPGAISIPDSEFDKSTDKLPTDKAASLIFYCEDVSCVLSPKSAAKAVALGYTNVMTMPVGYVGWVKAYGPGAMADGAAPTAAAAPAAAPGIEPGKEKGSITVASFEKILKEAPDSVVIADVRDPAEFATGSFKNAVNIPVNTLDKKIGTLPTDKPIIFFCTTGARGGEAYDMVKLLRPELKVYFLNAAVKFAKDGSYTIVEVK
ncbi:sulfurtransferase [Sulfuricaulis limicola]|uniref:Sulfurtransferase n=1 Tax=Sulfuricaulis limicola TaxID=1620215 RepID=A0A1B4XHZ0_9GAMM|nr:rhodanese-like domain-containing protein [Sulfuricaulis limicola]BAV34423.1 sulfurtransferase [Sulfuricaulis limicola]